MTECNVCPPSWLPTNDVDGRKRVIRCWHRGAESLILYRHFDLPSFVCLVRNGKADDTPTERIAKQELFMDYESGLLAFLDAVDEAAPGMGGR